MALIEPKRQKPITIRLNEKRAYVVLDDETVDPISLEEKTPITSKNYGITVYTADGGRYYYKTQSNIVSAEIKRDYLIIYEEGKSIPWKISKKGICLNRARFDETKESDIKYVKDTYGLEKEAIPSINDYEPAVEYDVIIEPRVENPLTIMFNDEKYNREDFLDKEGKFKIDFSRINPTAISKNESVETPLKKGVMYDPAHPHYGFKVMSARKSKIFETQCRIVAMEIRDDRLIVYEEGKKTSWEIDINVDVEQWGQFLDISRQDIRYVEENFGLTRDDIEDINSYGLKYVNEEY